VLRKALVAVVRHVDLLAACNKSRPQLLQAHSRAACAGDVRPWRQHRRRVQHADRVAGPAKIDRAALSSAGLKVKVWYELAAHQGTWYLMLNP
jgi:hypothetical protein